MLTPGRRPGDRPQWVVTLVREAMEMPIPEERMARGDRTPRQAEWSPWGERRAREEWAPPLAEALPRLVGKAEGPMCPVREDLVEARVSEVLRVPVRPPARLQWEGPRRVLAGFADPTAH